MHQYHHLTITIVFYEYKIVLRNTCVYIIIYFMANDKQSI